MSTIKEKVWAEKYRPTSIDNYIFADDRLRDLCEDWKTKGSFPNLILAGIQGTGKSTLARILVNEFELDNSDVLIIDGSVHNKVEDVRQKIYTFADIYPMGNFKLVIVEEAHRLTKDAQSALLETVERNHETVRFIFTTNFPKKLLDPLRSRCQLFTFDSFNEDGVFDLIALIMENEGIPDDEDTLGTIQEHVDTHKPDIRSIISSIQYSFTGDELLRPSASMRGGSIDEWEEMWMSEEIDVDRMIELTRTVDTTNFENFYVAVYEKGLHHFEDPGTAIVTISDFLSRATNATTQGIHSIHLEAMIHTLFSYGGE